MHSILSTDRKQVERPGLAGAQPSSNLHGSPGGTTRLVLHRVGMTDSGDPAVWLEVVILLGLGLGVLWLLVFLAVDRVLGRSRTADLHSRRKAY